MTDLDTLITDLRAKAEGYREAYNARFPNYTGLKYPEDGAYLRAINPTTILTILDALTELRGEGRHATCDKKLASLAATLVQRDTEIATLRAEVERLEDRLIQVRHESATKAEEIYICAVTERDALRADNERLRAENSRLIKSNTGESYQAGPITKRVIAYIKDHPKFTVQEMLVALLLPEKRVRNTLAYCVRRGALKRLGYGQYEVPAPPSPESE